MHVIAHGPYAHPGRARAIGVDLVIFDKGVSSVDFISLHMPLTPSTYQVYNDEHLTDELFNIWFCGELKSLLGSVGSLGELAEIYGLKLHIDGPLNFIASFALGVIKYVISRIIEGTSFEDQTEFMKLMSRCSWGPRLGVAVLEVGAQQTNWKLGECICGPDVDHIFGFSDKLEAILNLIKAKWDAISYSSTDEIRTAWLNDHLEDMVAKVGIWLQMK